MFRYYIEAIDGEGRVSHAPADGASAPYAFVVGEGDVVTGVPKSGCSCHTGEQPAAYDVSWMLALVVLLVRRRRGA